jgi:hypothetical protein
MRSANSMYNVFSHSCSHMWCLVFMLCAWKVYSAICTVQTMLLLVTWLFVEVQCHVQLRVQLQCLPQSIETALHCPNWQYKSIYSQCPQQPWQFSCIVPYWHGAWLVSLKSYFIRCFLQKQTDQHLSCTAPSSSDIIRTVFIPRPCVCTTLLLLKYAPYLHFLSTSLS